MTGVIWHDIECGRYEQDLPLWLGLARERVKPGDAVLDIGAGTGRVSLALARAGYRVVALDRDPELLRELELRAAGLPVQTVCADARRFTTEGQVFPLIVVPMQTVQLLGGAAGHTALLRCARAHLASGGVAAVAFADISDFEEFQWREGDSSPLPDIAELDGNAYFSQPTAVRRQGATFVLERRREIVAADGERVTSEDSITLDVLSGEGLRRAARSAGLRPLGLRRIAPTDEHIGSEVVILGG